MTSDGTNPTELSCGDVEALISGIIDGELDRDLRHAAEVHLLSCPACRAKVNEAEALDDLTVKAAERAGPEVLPDRVRLGVLSAVQREQSRKMRLPMVTWSGWAVAAALLLFVGYAGVSGWWGGGQRVTAPGSGAVQIQLTGDEREAVISLRMLSRLLGGTWGEDDYQELLILVREAQDNTGQPLITQLVGSKERAAIQQLSQRSDISEPQRQVLLLADRLISDLERGEPIERQQWQTLRDGLARLQIG